MKNSNETIEEDWEPVMAVADQLFGFFTAAYQVAGAIDHDVHNNKQ